MVDSILVSVDFSNKNDTGVMVVGRKRMNQSVKIINAFQGDEARELYEKNLSFSVQAKTELQVLIATVGRIVDTAYEVFDKQDMNLTRDVEPLEEIVDELSKELKRRHVNRLRSGECTIEMGFILTDLLTSLERIADHCSNISVCVTQVRENLYDTHSHLESLKNEPDDSYFNRLEELQKEYVLP